MDLPFEPSRIRDDLRDGARWARGLLSARNLLFIILALALWWRLIYVMELPGQTIPGARPSLQRLQGDAVSYDSVARSLLDGKGYVNSAGEVPVVPPGWPTFLAGVYGASAGSWAAARIASAFISAATCGVVFLIGRKAFNPAVGLLAAAAAAAYPWFIFWNRWLSTESLFIFLLSLGILAMLWAVEKPTPRNLALVGFLLAIANLTHTTAPFLPALFSGWLLLSLGPQRGVRAAGFILVVFFLTLAPWTLRNYLHYQQVLPVSAHGGINLYAANNPYANPDKVHPSDDADVDPAVMQQLEGRPFLEKDRILRSKAINYILDHPRTFISNALQRVQLLWKSESSRPIMNTPLLSSEYYRANIDHFLLVFMYVGGAVAALTRWRTAAVLLLVPLQFSLLHMFFPVMPFGRSRVVTMQVAIIFAAFTVYAAWRLLALTPLAWQAARSGIRERSWQDTWETIKAGLRS